jgi:hypothetical protein
LAAATLGGPLDRNSSTMPELYQITVTVVKDFLPSLSRATNAIASIAISPTGRHAQIPSFAIWDCG